MEKRVVKFSLIGAICVIVLIVITIIGGIFLIKKIRAIKNGDDSVKIKISAQLGTITS